MDSAIIRQQLRQRRRSISDIDQLNAASKVAVLAQKHQILSGSKRIAVYLPNDGEINPEPLANLARAASISVYLPVLDPNNNGHLIFAEWLENTCFTPNRFGIPEPVSADTILASDLDIIFMPLVGFDLEGNRIGMGGGFYDRTLECVRKKNEPGLIGLAHQFQLCTQLVSQPWDVPMNAVLTDQSWYNSFSRT